MGENGHPTHTEYDTNGNKSHEKVDGESAGDTTHKSPRKRRKVNHACVYCRRSHMTCDLERPCTRCIKRNIGHLCHDEPREADVKKLKGVGTDAVEPQNTQPDASLPPMAAGTGRPPLSQRSSSLDAPRNVTEHDRSRSLVQPVSASGPSLGNTTNGGRTGNTNQFAGFSDAWMTAQNFPDMNNYNPNYMIAPELTHEFNLLNDFLHTSLLDDNGHSIDDHQTSSTLLNAAQADLYSKLSGNSNGNDGNGNLKNANGVFPETDVNMARRLQSGSMPPPPMNMAGKGLIRPDPSTSGEKDKTREYYLQAADPSGNDTPDERMSRVLRAKYDAGLLKPFNYINGYARLGKYLDGHIAAISKQKILRTINQFRPKFREKAQGLTDMQLVYVEMWFERQLMDYDRVFASMAVPACCWRRTGEIFRGNKEMAELINVPVDELRDGKIAIHEILTEESMVRYWEEFGTIAFDPQHDTLLTACSLKNPSDSSSHPIVKCCFSFNIRRDEHKLPALIVGNFLPHDPSTH